MADNSKKDPTEPPRKNTIEDRPAQQKAKACHLLQEALRLVQEARESYSGFDYTAATQNLEALATDKTPIQDPQSPNRIIDCCNALQELANLRKEVHELKELLILTAKSTGPTQKGNTYSEVLNKGQATTKPPHASVPGQQKENDRKEHTLVLLKDKDQALPRFDPVLIRDRINARLQCNAIKGVHASPKGNVVLTSLSLTASQLLQEQQRWQEVFQGWPITAAEKPDTWPKLVAHFVPTSLSPTSFAEEVKRFNDIEIQGNV
ncbi:uncharacterized protein PG998_015184 [Apiospora kogelbergensis]|uniref:uncharacterized protein n=1 Tax=Apiospora kogelbergensis TaxID=1337665 RepID=UPI0031315AC7